MADLIRSIELNDAERQARDEAALKAARERGAAAGSADVPTPKPAAGAAAAQEEEKKGDKPYGNLDPAVVKSIEETILDSSPNVHWDDVKGLAEVK